MLPDPLPTRIIQLLKLIPCSIMIIYFIVYIPVVIRPSLHRLATEALSGYFHQCTSHPERETSLASPPICMLTRVKKTNSN